MPICHHSSVSYSVWCRFGGRGSDLGGCTGNNFGFVVCCVLDLEELTLSHVYRTVQGSLNVTRVQVREGHMHSRVTRGVWKDFGLVLGCTCNRSICVHVVSSMRWSTVIYISNNYLILRTV